MNGETLSSPKKADQQSIPLKLHLHGQDCRNPSLPADAPEPSICSPQDLGEGTLPINLLMSPADPTRCQSQPRCPPLPQAKQNVSISSLGWGAPGRQELLYPSSPGSPFSHTTRLLDTLRPLADGSSSPSSIPLKNTHRT